MRAACEIGNVRASRGGAMIMNSGRSEDVRLSVY